ncbi:MAG TPA: hypothetical protein VNZ53_41060 [Steroidobacteraceae bacterium]|nr:hypothetical protein [Steroidobacteraceae bacterium]
MKISRTIVGVVATLAIASWSASSFAGTNTQLAQLYQLQAAFHRAATVHDPVNGDSPAVIDQRIRDMLSLWTDDGSLTLEVGGALDGDYLGNGDPGIASTCPAPSGDPSNRGTLCTFFKYVAGSFKPANKFVSLAPSYKTSFDVHGNTATVYFECHYFNVAIDPATGKPLWTAASHVAFDGSAEKVQGTWLFSHANGPVAGIPIP